MRAMIRETILVVLIKNNPDLEEVNCQTKTNSTYESRLKGFHQVTLTAGADPFQTEPSCHHH